jgi:hypothetical protein
MFIPAFREWHSLFGYFVVKEGTRVNRKDIPSRNFHGKQPLHGLHVAGFRDAHDVMQQLYINVKHLK